MQVQPYLTYKPRPQRNVTWVGHDSEAAVRRSMAVGTKGLRIFERVGEPGDMHIEYSEILPEHWADRFAK